ncbi:FG-GAP-like repeat-containing protein [Streptomyces sp. NBC_00272]|uniref:FG-GAP-like repeat-containing protein n=1 Tax=Streptomyces sp. NBC_00272 TaxID=2975698 RepID=UPI002E2DFF0D|nr:FG-GAP-like repeat-containing protein [Streptomyces sp. NBC_00272]
MSVPRPRAARMTGLLAATAVLSVGVIPTVPAFALAGPEAAAGQQSSAVRLTLGDEANSRACTGSLVDRFWVLTAASCFADTPGTTVPAGKPALKATATLSDGKTVEITEIAPRADRDAALVRLATAVIGIKPATLAATVPAANTELTAAGFGRTKTEWVTDKLHTGTFTVNSATPTTLAVTGKGTDVLCKGDTGGPLLNGAGEIVGVNSRSWQGGCLGTPATETRTGAISTRTDDLGQWITASIPRSQGASSDFNGDGKADLALTGGANWDCLPVAMSKGDGAFNTTCNAPVGGSWGYWASTPNVKVVKGDFNADGKTDMALTGGANWDCLPVALSKGDGTFNVNCNAPVGGYWGEWAATPNAKVVSGDFNADGKTDMALTGGANWDCLPVAMSKGDGTFNVNCNAPVGGSWGFWASTPNVKVVSGDFNADGRTDMALTGGSGWDCLPVALSKGDGTFNVNCNAPGLSWGDWAATSNVKVVNADLNGDGRTDMALTGGANWDCLPVAMSKGDGTFTTTCNAPVGGSWGFWASTPNVKVVSGDFNADGKTDMALTGGSGWDCLPVALSKGDGTFNVNCNAPGLSWGDWAATSNVKVVSGDLNGDGRTDMALTGGANWDCLPVAMSKGDGTFTTTCKAPGLSWGFWAATSGVTVV